MRWSQQVPDARVVIVGTHVDDPALSRTSLEQIWRQLRDMLKDARRHHQRYFTRADRLHDCLLCHAEPPCYARRPSAASQRRDYRRHSVTNRRDERRYSCSDLHDGAHRRDYGRRHSCRDPCDDIQEVCNSGPDNRNDHLDTGAAPSPRDNAERHDDRHSTSDPRHSADGDRQAGGEARLVKETCCDGADHSETRAWAPGENGSVAHSDDNDDDDDDTSLRYDDDERTLMFPHVVGYYEVSCAAGGRGMAQLRDAVTQQAARLIGVNAEMPRRWSSVERSLTARRERGGAGVCSVDELRDIADVQGVSDPHELVNMMQFFRAQGRLLYFPQVSQRHSVSNVSVSRLRKHSYVAIKILNT